MLKLKAKILNKSVRAIFNYLRFYKEKGIKFVIHGNTNKVPANKTSSIIKEKAMDLILNKYLRFQYESLSRKIKRNT